MADGRFSVQSGNGVIMLHAITAPLEHNDACFIVKDATGQALGYFYFEDQPGRRSAAKLLRASDEDLSERVDAPPDREKVT
jgi:hypothetical protein